MSSIIIVGVSNFLYQSEDSDSSVVQYNSLRAGTLGLNPWSGIKSPTGHGAPKPVGRSLTDCATTQLPHDVAGRDLVCSTTSDAQTNNFLKRRGRLHA